MTDINLLPLPDWMECLGEVSAEDIRNYARDNVARATALLRAENEALRAGVGETKEVAVRAMRQRDAQYNRAERLAEALREYGLPLTGDDKRDSWEFGYEAFAREKRRRAALEQESVMDKSISECKQARSHDELIAELLDSRVPKTEREHAAVREIERLRTEVDRLTLEMDHLQQQYDERTACMIVHGGSALACSDAVRSAYLDERRRAYRLAELLDQAYGYVPFGELADQIHCALTKGYGNDV